MVQVHAVEFRGNPIGNITGTVTGGAATANKLTSASTFEISGDVSSIRLHLTVYNRWYYKSFPTQISNTFIADKNLASLLQTMMMKLLSALEFQVMRQVYLKYPNKRWLVLHHL